MQLRAIENPALGRGNAQSGRALSKKYSSYELSGFDNSVALGRRLLFRASYLNIFLSSSFAVYLRLTAPGRRAPVNLGA